MGFLFFTVRPQNGGMIEVLKGALQEVEAEGISNSVAVQYVDLCLYS